MTAVNSSADARAERFAFEQTLRDKLARIAAHYERLEEALARIEEELAIDANTSPESVELAENAPCDLPRRTSRPTRRGKSPRKPR